MFPRFYSPAKGPLGMRRWPQILIAIMLVLLIWTGNAAQASHRFDCIPATADTAGHFEGDGDEWPSGSEKGAAHHHASCSGHQFAAPAETAAPVAAEAQKTLPDGREAFGLAGRVPDDQLRPPIA